MWAESQSFIKRVFGGVSNMLVANFIEEVDLSQKDIEKLQKILEEKQKKMDKKINDF
ncbi:Methicillin resistance regulatory protein MecI [compost metagenome]